VGDMKLINRDVADSARIKIWRRCGYMIHTYVHHAGIDVYDELTLQVTAQVMDVLRWAITDEIDQ
jgi:hypothetical protein